MTDRSTVSGEPEYRRVTVVPGGPLLVEGPVELALDDGTTVRSERFVVAVCACRRSKRFPFCDTSHRERVRVSPSVTKKDSKV
ncbi:CDGSH iron-sulfur domain-containing protein [Actinophytocola oryzae]|uniref:Iron-binding CDGSH zinc finger protein n=1 Tax=Actinophytocola oryzae TaxID=502181 RepID=A0A4R7V892_9PSEU|nr:CDGSH iron-sulfur domain-containing protein [Actinophytocola oryzae]TDV44316.1 iron-binding CDGSH zinc finger protein [Actinophytocola oryzae]